MNVIPSFHSGRRLSPSLFVILNPSLLVILNEVKNLKALRVNASEGSEFFSLRLKRDSSPPPVAGDSE
jgi:hypothetical protein